MSLILFWRTENLSTYEKAKSLFRWLMVGAVGLISIPFAGHSNFLLLIGIFIFLISGVPNWLSIEHSKQHCKIKRTKGLWMFSYDGVANEE